MTTVTLVYSKNRYFNLCKTRICVNILEASCIFSTSTQTFHYKQYCIKIETFWGTGQSRYTKDKKNSTVDRKPRAQEILRRNTDPVFMQKTLITTKLYKKLVFFPESLWCTSNCFPGTCFKFAFFYQL